MLPYSKPWSLDRVKPLQPVTPEQRRRLEASTVMRDVRRGERIYAPGDPGDVVCAVAQGVVKLATGSPDEREVTLGFVNAGELFGELAIVDDSPRDHAAEAHEDAVVGAIDRTLLVDLVRETPALGYEFNRVLGRRVKMLRERVEELLCKSAQTRVARAITALADTHGISDAAGVLIPLRLSQRDLASLSGLSRETINAVLQEFRGRDLVETDHRRLRVLRPAMLRAMR